MKHEHRWIEICHAGIGELPKENTPERHVMKKVGPVESCDCGSKRILMLGKWVLCDETDE
jgi:hypothetical protein